MDRRSESTQQGACRLFQEYLSAKLKISFKTDRDETGNFIAPVDYNDFIVGIDQLPVSTEWNKATTLTDMIVCKGCDRMSEGPLAKSFESISYNFHIYFVLSLLDSKYNFATVTKCFMVYHNGDEDRYRKNDNPYLIASIWLHQKYHSDIFDKLLTKKYLFKIIDGQQKELLNINSKLDMILEAIGIKTKITSEEEEENKRRSYD